MAANQAVGVDVERVSPRVQRIKNRFLTEQEQVIVGATDADLMLAWSVKEAVYKMYGSKKLLFKEHIRLTERNNEVQVVRVDLVTPEYQQHLQVAFCFLEEVVLSWVKQPA
jgi:4'-phosphopantetheinyl transferase EntD